MAEKTVIKNNKYRRRWLLMKVVGAAADDDPLPAIEGLQILGEAYPGRELQACGYSINGTTSCNFEFVLLGAVPFPKDVPRLKELCVGGVIALNEPYETLVPSSLYHDFGIEHLVIPTIDYAFAPSFIDISSAVEFIHKNASCGRTTYVHCKARRGRSTTIVLCYLVKYKHMTPTAALEYVRSRRPRVLLAPIQWRVCKPSYYSFEENLLDIIVRISMTSLIQYPGEKDLQEHTCCDLLHALVRRKSICVHLVALRSLAQTLVPSASGLRNSTESNQYVRNLMGHMTTYLVELSNKPDLKSVIQHLDIIQSANCLLDKIRGAASANEPCMQAWDAASSATNKIIESIAPVPVVIVCNAALRLMLQILNWEFRYQNGCAKARVNEDYNI
ncbi:hypothetical protein ACFE04_021437 [Oxalis oulophora]